MKKVPPKAVGEDGLSRLVRRFLAAEDVRSTSVEEETDQIISDLREFLMERDGLDPMESYVFRDGKCAGETLGSAPSLKTLHDIGSGSAIAVMGWKVTRESLQSEGRAFTHPDWYAAKLIGIALQILVEEGDVRDRALRAFGHDWRDMQWRLGYGRKAVTRIGQDRDLIEDLGGGRADYIAKRSAQAEAWHQNARRLADEIRAKNSKLNDSDVAKGVYKRFEKMANEIARATNAEPLDLSSSELAEEIVERQLAAGVLNYEKSVPDVDTIRRIIARNAETRRSSRKGSAKRTGGTKAS